MIDTLLGLLDRQLNEEIEHLEQLLAERRGLRQRQAAWREHLHHVPVNPSRAIAGADIEGWLAWGAKADHELKNLEEKDFLVEERISQSRTVLLKLQRRKDALTEVMRRRTAEIERISRRRREREMTQKGAARKALERGDQVWH